MSSGNDVRGNVADQLRLDAGTQALVSVSGLQPTIRLLPTDAYENLVVVTSTGPDEVERWLAEMGVTPSSVGVVPISAAPVAYDGPVQTTDSLAPDDLTGVSMRYSRTLDGLAPGHGWILFDSLNEFLVYADEKRVLRLLDHVAGQTREANVRGVYPVVREAVDDRTYARLRRNVDTEIDLR